MNECYYIIKFILWINVTILLSLYYEWIVTILLSLYYEWMLLYY